MHNSIILVGMGYIILSYDSSIFSKEWTMAMAENISFLIFRQCAASILESHCLSSPINFGNEDNWRKLWYILGPTMQNVVVVVIQKSDQDIKQLLVYNVIIENF